MRAVFFGSPEFALPTLRSLIAAPDVDVVLVVTNPDRPRGRRANPLPTPAKALAVESGIELLQPQRLRRDSTERIAALHPDVGIVAASGHMLPNHLLDAFPHGVLNVHASLLPRHRGASAVASSILAGDEQTGATIMRVVREVDAGPVLASVRTSIGALDTTAALTDRIAQLGAALLLELLPRWVAREIEATPQDGALATLAPRLEKADGRIDWTMPARDIWRRVRAFQPWPLATARYAGDAFTLHEAWPLDAASAGPPGSVAAGDGAPLPDPIADRRARVLVACGEGSLVLLRVQRAGRRALDIEQYVNGDHDLLGSLLE